MSQFPIGTVPNEHVGDALFGLLGGYFEKIHNTIDSSIVVPAAPSLEDLTNGWLVDAKRKMIEVVANVSDDTAEKAGMIQFFHYYFHLHAISSKEWQEFYDLLYATVAKRWPTFTFPWHRKEMIIGGFKINAVVEN